MVPIINTNNFRYLKKPSNVNVNIKDFEEFADNIGTWEYPNAWKIVNEELNSNILKEEFSKWKQIVIEFVKDGYSTRIGQKYNKNIDLLGKFAYIVAETDSIDTAFIFTFYVNFQDLIAYIYEILTEPRKEEERFSYFYEEMEKLITENEIMSVCLKIYLLFQKIEYKSK